ncbi:hypothetical protein, partial [Pseudomonas syringae]|uniref:hypothetical protein n=1 Tax=Pseudomonas syringae TaxID=317 RepID=UPI001E40AD23
TTSQKPSINIFPSPQNTFIARPPLVMIRYEIAVFACFSSPHSRRAVRRICQRCIEKDPE